MQNQQTDNRSDIYFFKLKYDPISERCHQLQSGDKSYNLIRKIFKLCLNFLDNNFFRHHDALDLQSLWLQTKPIEAIQSADQMSNTKR